MQITNSQISAIYRKILYKKNIAPLNIAYTKSNTLYDACLNNIDDKYLNFIPNSLSDECLGSHILFVNDPIEITHDQRLSNLLVNKVLFFHDDKILRMKKEDLFLFKQQVSSYTKYSFNINVCSVMTDVIPIRYGFKKINEDIENRVKNIVFIGNEQNINLLAYRHIKQIYSDTDFISLEKNNTTDIASLLSQYKICISMDSSYNSLLGAANGCYVISSTRNDEIPYHHTLRNFEELLSSISEIMKIYNKNHHKEISDKIIDQYNYSTFISAINNIVKHTCDRAIIL